MGRMKLRIRGKLIGILLIAAVLPLCIAILAIEVLGYHYYKRERGRLLQQTASFLAMTIEHSLHREIHKLHDWLALAPPADLLLPSERAVAALSEPALTKQITDFETRWPALTPESPEMATLLTNQLARALREFQALNPLYAEIFITDARGRLVAATHKTSDYWQADEDWWQRASRVASPRYYGEGIHWDDSAGVYSVDICIPIRRPGETTSPPLGVLKAVLNASPVFSSVPSTLLDEGPSREVVQANGKVLFELYSRMSNRIGEQVAPAALAPISARQPGWKMLALNGDSVQLVGHAPLNLGGTLLNTAGPTGIEPLFVIVHDNAAAVLAPVRKQLWMLSLSGAAIILLFSLAGLYIATRKIIGPMEVLRNAVKTIAESARLNSGVDQEDVHTGSPAARAALAEVQRIDTDDEIEDLARDFASMARRVLRYHEQLEEELAAKTSEIQQDLQFAREFQEALMPRHYPQVACAHARHTLALNFHHVYQPASSVGGDFFDVLKLSDKRAGIFIADVMGHGARSALVTAILRTLLQDLANHGNDPARFLALINQHFADITAQSNQLVFVSAFYLIVDTEKSIATYASAGHPSPYLADRSQGTVTALIESLKDNPALGLFPDSHYTNFTSFIKPDDVFILYTDGIFEATSPGGEEFGLPRVRQAIENNLAQDLPHICHALLEELNDFTETQSLPDDICIVGVEVAGVGQPAPLPT